MLNQPATIADFTRAFDQLAFAVSAPVVVAISGGSDSTALLVGLTNYFKQNEMTAEIVAVTIDHGLRPESALEAQQVAQLCRDLSVRHLVEKWEGADKSSGIQAAAREARYTHLGRVARELGAQFVVTGHTLDDQLETITMRSSRGNGRGLAGIPAATLFDRSTWFVRPLLGTCRNELRGYLLDRDIGWIDDPSNDNMDFERVQIRQRQFSAAEQHQILGVQSAAQSSREKDAIAGAQFISDHAKFDIDANSNEGRMSLNSLDEAGFEPALQALMCRIGGRAHFASSATMEKILNLARKGKNGRKFTAHGCLFALNAGTLVVKLEDRAKPGGKYCFDYLLSNSDFALANALNSRLKRPDVPLAPIKVATC